MADAPKILGTDSLRQAYPKLNSAIDNSNEALTKATTAETNSTTAINTANAAETKADSVQEQFNQVVIEGDSSVEAAQARVKADGTSFPTLQGRLNDTDAQLAQKAEQGEVRKETTSNPIMLSELHTEVKTAMTGGSVPVVDVDAVGTENLKDRATTLIKINKSELEKISPNQQRLLEEYKSRTLNLLQGVNDGNTQFYMQGTGASGEYADNDSFLPVLKLLRFNYSTSTSYIAVNQTFDFSVISKPVWGGWFRKSDLINLGERGIYGILRVFKGDNSSYQPRTPVLSSEKCLEVGYSESYINLGVELEISVKEEFQGWIYIQCKTISNTITDGVSFYPRWVANAVPTTGKLDIVNYTVIDNEEILPYKVYPETETEIPFTISELNDEVKQLKSTTLLQSDWYGKRAAMIGDSIVQGGHYIRVLNEKLGFAELRNYGVAGRPMANGTANGPGNNTTGRMLAGETLDYSPIDLVIIAAGTNDFKLNVPIGQLQETGYTGYNTEEFYGAYQDLIEYLLNFKNTMRIVLMTPLHRDNSEYTIYSTNTAGHKLDDYRQAIFKIGENYALPVVDMYANSGINKLNFNPYALDGLHLNESGGNRAGGYLAKQIANIGL